MTKRDILPKSLATGFDTLPNFSKWAAEVIKQESVTYFLDEENLIQKTAEKIKSLKAKAGAK